MDTKRFDTTNISVGSRSGLTTIGGRHVTIRRQHEACNTAHDVSAYGDGVHIHLEQVVQKDSANSVKGIDPSDSIAGTV